MTGPHDQGGPAPSAPRRRRRGPVVALVAVGLVVVAGVALGLVVLLTRGDGGPATAVRTYLQALADGDARTALDQGSAPPDTTFLTHDTLEVQQGVARISAIHVGDGTTSGNHARVSATYTFGDRHADQSFSLTEIGGTWKLDDTTYPISLSGLDGVPGLTLLGAPTSGKDEIYVFPGPLVWGSSNRYLTVVESGADQFALSPTDGSAPTLEAGLSAAGRQAAADAVRSHLGACARSKDLAPAHCPQSEADYAGVDGTAVWTAPTDLSALAYRVSSPVTRAYVTGELTWKVTYVAEDYTGAKRTVTDPKVVSALYGTVDLTRTPPVYSE